MKAVYQIAGFSRQAHWEYMRRRAKLEEQREALLLSVAHIRQIHPSIGGKKLYWLLQPDFLGRDLFFDFLRENDLLVEPTRSRTKTTYSTRSHWYSNLVAGLDLWGCDQLWVSDITYYRIGDKFYYLVFILDVYSRRILGFNASDHMRATSNLKALKMALNFRERDNYKVELIHHSDQGVQYASIAYTDQLKAAGIRISMSSNVLENAHIERVNGTIKNQYLTHWHIPNFKSLKTKLKKAVTAYNDCPHWSLDFHSPIQWEAKIEAMPKRDRTILRLYDENKGPRPPKVRNQLNLFE